MADGKISASYLIGRFGNIWIEMLPLALLGCYVGINCYVNCFGFESVAFGGRIAMLVMLALYLQHFLGKFELPYTTTPLWLRNAATLMYATFSIFTWKGFVCIARLNQVDQGHWFMEVAWQLGLIIAIFGLFFCIDTFQRDYEYLKDREANKEL